MMAFSGEKQYPDHLNPFGSDDEDDINTQNSSQITSTNEYPDHLDPFLDSQDQTSDLNASCLKTDTYDDSLNPFGSEEGDERATEGDDPPKSTPDIQVVKAEGRSSNVNLTASNPFGNSDDENEQDQPASKTNNVPSNDTPNPTMNGISEPVPQELSEPPKPLPRTKSLLKKELIMKNKQKQQQLQLQAEQNSTDPVTSFSSAASTTSSSSIANTNNSSSSATVGSFQRRKNKRNAPPVPVNFKRQVSGSFSAIEEELDNIGDMLAIIEKETNLCQDDLKNSYDTDMSQFATSQAKLIELIKRKNSIVRRQRELMYRKRELNLDQLHSDIEYELRMIGNKQLSHRTAEDEIKEKQLLKKLVEIVEEKSDIVENLNKDYNCDDEHDIEEVFKRLNISKISNNEGKEETVTAAPDKGDHCDKKSSHKFTKLATLLPKSGTIKSTIKIKRKRPNKKNDSQPVP